MTTEPAEIRLKRLQMRSMRRGIKEMDIILGGFSRRAMADLTPQMLDLYEALLEENDQDLYQWVSGQMTAPAAYVDLIRHIAKVQETREI
jgi:antitoxin CptB